MAMQKVKLGWIMNRSLQQVEQVGNPLTEAIKARDNDVLSVVRFALDAQNAQLAFQPIVAAQSPDTVAFYEGLIRVRDETGRIIPAGQFMPRIEEHELGREIDCASLRLGLATLMHYPDLRLSINMSARSMADGKWRRILDEGLARSPHVAERLILEISESSAMLLHEVLVRFMAEMQPRGVSFALDHFGGGMTAFKHLKDFFFDLVKIDRCFIHNIDKNPENQVLTEALVAVAQQFEMFAVAEGVENQSETLILQKLGVECLQGYHFGVPRLQL